jgi:hypothetical protein
MHAHPVPPIKGGQPPKTGSVYSLPHKQSEDIQRLSKQYLERRNHQILLKSQAAEVELAVRRGTLIEKRLVEQQATWLLVAARRKLINLDSHAYRFMGLTDITEAKQLLREIGLNVLNELKDLPKTADKDWLKTVEENA